MAAALTYGKTPENTSATFAGAKNVSLQGEDSAGQTTGWHVLRVSHAGCDLGWRGKSPALWLLLLEFHAD